MANAVYKFILDIMNPNIKSDVVRVRDVIHLAEDTDFTVEQSKIVSPWLLKYALKNRDSSDTEDEYPVYSAIRTGASMLTPDLVHWLFPLLEKGHQIDTSLVTVKMIGRMFAAQPPSKVGEYENIAEKVYDFLNPMLDRHLAVSPGRDGAIAELCATSLVAMGSEKIYPILEKVKDKERWFKQYLLHNAEELKATWESRAKSVSDNMMEFLNEVIKKIQEMTNE